jgi:protein sidekick
VSLAASSVVVIIIVISILCVKSKSYKYKRECIYRIFYPKIGLSYFNCFFFPNSEEAQKTLEESIAMSIDERQELALELYRSRHGGGGTSTAGTLTATGTMSRRTMGTLGRTKNSSSAAMAALGKSPHPPRPSPASVAYHSDEESLKCYDENPDDSSVTEKPSEMSSSDSQVSSK